MSQLELTLEKTLEKGRIAPFILDLDGSPKDHRKNWSRLINKIYEMDPLTSPKCQGRINIFAFIEDGHVIKKILKHVDL